MSAVMVDPMLISSWCNTNSSTSFCTTWQSCQSGIIWKGCSTCTPSSLIPRYMKDIVAVHPMLTCAGTVPDRTIGNPRSQIVRDRMPCRDMVGGMGEVNIRSHVAITSASSLRYPSRIRCTSPDSLPSNTSFWTRRRSLPWIARGLDRCSDTHSASASGRSSRSMSHRRLPSRSSSRRDQARATTYRDTATTAGVPIPPPFTEGGPILHAVADMDTISLDRKTTLPHSSRASSRRRYASFVRKTSSRPMALPQMESGSCWWDAIWHAITLGRAKLTKSENSDRAATDL